MEHAILTNESKAANPLTGCIERCACSEIVCVESTVRGLVSCDIMHPVVRTAHVPGSSNERHGWI